MDGDDDSNDGNGNEESVGVIWLPVKEGDGFAQIPTYLLPCRQTDVFQSKRNSCCSILPLPLSKVLVNSFTNPPDPRYEDLTINTVPRNAW